MATEFDFDAACALSKGKRRYQEDAIISDFARGGDIGLVVLADGMGGHAAGDVASKIVVTEVFSELMFQRGDPDGFETRVCASLLNAAMAANVCIKDHIGAHPETKGMGATLVASAIVNQSLYWISIGDSPLLLFRNGVLLQLNEDHSMAPQIDYMVKTGLLPPEEGACHPDRNTLTSALCGQDIPKVDCPQEPTILKEGDILVIASDGLQFLSNDRLERTLQREQHRHSSEIADILMQEVIALGDPDLDNVSFSLIKVQDSALHKGVNENALTLPKIRCVG
ncbi:MAG: protein phosphatase 2C domain-containing protein [Roseobacter sp.]